MKAIAFRFTEGPTKKGFIGVAFGQNLEDLFWTIDEFGDPGLCEYKPVFEGGACWLEKMTYAQDELTEVTRTRFEISEHMPNVEDDDGWKPFPATRVMRAFYARLSARHQEEANQ
ncbi:hypothetical protein UFOVP73_19 [uncultured Caudovirales phage]|uniref:Uncharacterized protein n=1 Tax=uncultured Caudovirales phage TaxID=2100421 RepID=A0A6J5KUN5_9CAUD|nr:hypothetical protein UFOVP73_19 [uncultured Caudovirales phage]CAB5195028.1 hypothetical protein UFOVP170_41 [uncultured Caudovirales phage]